MSSPEVVPTAATTEAFELLSNTVRDWRAKGRRTTTAGVTSALLAAGLDVVALGFGTKEEYWRAAEAAGVVERRRLPNNHWYVLLPGEDLPPDVGVPREPSSVAPSSPRRRSGGALPAPGAIRPPSRLRSDVWSAFVDWEGAYRRFWDRSHLRAFVVPAEWVPQQTEAALVMTERPAEVGRFIEITPAAFGIQVAWMREFASRQNDNVRVALHTALSDDAPRGSFRRSLDVFGLVGTWRDEHRRYVNDFVAEWAEANGLDVGVLLDSRPTQAPRRSPTTPHHADPGPVDGPDINAATADRGGASRARSTAPTRAHAALRDRVQVAVQAMSFEELAVLPIRAAHFLDG